MLHSTTLKPHIWIVEDDPGAQFVYRDTLSPYYHLKMAASIQEFRNYASQSPLSFSLIIADLSLPDGNFLDLLRKKENSLPNCSYLIVSSLDDLDILRACLNAGALGYLIKPFYKNELLVKVERILASLMPAPLPPSPHLPPLAPSGLAPDQDEIGDLVLDTRTLCLKRGQKKIRLTVKELQIFSLLQDEPIRPVPKSSLKKTVWDRTAVCDKALDVHLFNLRKKLSFLDFKIKHIAPESYVLLDQLTDAQSEKNRSIKNAE